jgi:hypothetical protein
MKAYSLIRPLLLGFPRVLEILDGACGFFGHTGVLS